MGWSWDWSYKSKVVEKRWRKEVRGCFIEIKNC